MLDFGRLCCCEAGVTLRRRRLLGKVGDDSLHSGRENAEGVFSGEVGRMSYLLKLSQSVK